MDLKSVLDTVATVAGTVNPAVELAIKAVNGFLPEDKRLPETATGVEVSNAISQLPSAAREAVYSEYIRLQQVQEEGWTERYRAMCEGDRQSTRPRIAYGCFLLLTFETLALTVLLFIKPDLLEEDALWMAFIALTSTPTAILLSYFGNLRKEQGQRLGVTSGLASLLSRIK